MATLKQIKNRILNTNKAMDKVVLNIARAAKNKNTIGLRRLNQEKAVLDRDLRKLKSQLIAARQEVMQKKTVDPC